VEREGAIAIRKTASGPQYNPRLKLQIEKQRCFSEMTLPPGVRVPVIISESIDIHGLYSAEMEYVYFQPSIIAFESISTLNLERLTNTLFGFIDFEIASSSPQKLDKSILRKKVDSVDSLLATSGMRNAYAEEIDKLRYRINEIDDGTEIPVGICHGDLTFSNIMVSSDSSSVGMIDFLDSFIETPIIDIVKIRQDSYLYWSTLMSRTPIDNIRIRNVLEHIDRSLLMKYGAFDWFDALANVFLSINLLRIAPYAVDEGIHRFVLESMRRVR
jgi:hypothetical protein